MKALLIAITLAWASIPARAFTPAEMARDVGEDVAKYIAVGEMCDYPNIEQAFTLLGVLARLSKPDAQAGIAAGRAFVDSMARRAPKADLCRAARPNRANVEGDIRVMLPMAISLLR
ncbi:MAG: hypothetical protein RI936_18 [Pseudomonadota bacterium]